MALYFCRHGQTEWNVAGRLQGHLDSPLTAAGQRQFQQLTQQLKLLNLGEIWSSDLGRCLASAEILATELELAVHQSPLLRERHFGELQGCFADQRLDLWSAYQALHQQDRLSIPHSESATELMQRVQQIYPLLVAKAARHNLLVITHGEWLRALLNWQQGHAPWSDKVSLPQNAQLIALSPS